MIDLLYSIYKIEKESDDIREAVFEILFYIKQMKLYLFIYPFEGGDPAAPSSTATLLRLHPSH